MTTTVHNNGRLGNQIIRNLVTSIIAEKFDLNVNYSSKSLIDELGIPLYSGKNIYKSTTLLTDDNFFYILNELHTLNHNINPNRNFFQTKEITNYLYNYIHTDNVKLSIMNNNKYKNRYDSNNDLFIHIRLTDVAYNSPGSKYFLKAIKNIAFDNLYIASDEINHDIIKEIITEYPNAIIINYNEVETIQFASTCKHIILSHGSFSAIIGYLSFFSNVYYPEYELNKIWYGDMFSIDKWNKILFV